MRRARADGPTGELTAVAELGRVLAAATNLRGALARVVEHLEDLVGAGYHSFAEKGPEGPAVTVELVDRRDTYKACARSWKRRPDVGQDPDYPDLCLRDAKAVRAAGK